MKNPPVLDDVLLLTCLWRVTTSLSGFIVSVGLMPKYRLDDALKLRVKKLAALAFIPVSDLVATFESLSTSFLNDELRLLAYFENTWIGQPVGGRRLPPLFPHHMWNVRDRSGTGSSRTTNALEAFHHTFNSLLTCQHPTIWKLLESLESHQNLSRSTIFKIGRGDSFRPSVQERRRNERIQNLVASYTQATADDLLRGIAYNYMM